MLLRTLAVSRDVTAPNTPIDHGPTLPESLAEPRIVVAPGATLIGVVGCNDPRPDLSAHHSKVRLLLFIAHFQRMARGHFIVRRLERAHGKMEVQRAYEGPVLTAVIAPPLLAQPISDAQTISGAQTISDASRRG